MGIVKDGASVGRIFLCDKKSSILGTLSYLHPKNGFNLYFCYYLLSTVHFQKYVVGSTIPHIYFKDYSKEKVKIPTLEKQEKIGSFLRCIDRKIKLLNKQIDLMKNYKSGLLQKMFI
ncbi:restriction endonuclease subunit S [Methanosphaera cuniculi]|uniref:restriction endonuclease subunit S n=1 Tax=Methanosphaera cuniculi TaxID=1077256 RepID=UPI000BAB2E96